MLILYNTTTKKKESIKITNVTIFVMFFLNHPNKQMKIIYKAFTWFVQDPRLQTKSLQQWLRTICHLEPPTSGALGRNP